MYSPRSALGCRRTEVSSKLSVIMYSRWSTVLSFFPLGRRDPLTPALMKKTSALSSLPLTPAHARKLPCLAAPLRIFEGCLRRNAHFQTCSEKCRFGKHNDFFPNRSLLLRVLMVHQRGIRTHTKREAASTDSRPGIAVDSFFYSIDLP